MMILVDPGQPLLKPSMHVTTTIDKVLGKVREVDQTSGERYTDLLGHKWDKQDDTFALKKDSVVRKKEDFTKRWCLALLAQVWDPYGTRRPCDD